MKKTIVILLLLVASFALLAAPAGAAEIISGDLSVTVSHDQVKLPPDGATVVPYVRMFGEKKWQKLDLQAVAGRKVFLTFKKAGKYELVFKSENEGAPFGSDRGEAVVIADPDKPEVKFLADYKVLRGGRVVNVRWSVRDVALGDKPVTVEFSRDGGQSWEIIARDLEDTGLFKWDVPEITTPQGVIKVTVVDKAGNVGTAKTGVFTVDADLPTFSFLSKKTLPGNWLELRFSASDDTTEVRRLILYVSYDKGETWKRTSASVAKEDSGQWVLSFGPDREGTAFLYVVAEDMAGNTTPAPRPGDAPTTAAEVKKAVESEFGEDFYPVKITKIDRRGRTKVTEVHFNLDPQDRNGLASVELWATSQGKVNWKVADAGVASPLEYEGPDGKIGFVVLVKKLDAPFFMKNGTSPSREVEIDTSPPEGGLVGLDVPKLLIIGSKLKIEWSVTDMSPVGSVSIEYRYEEKGAQKTETIARDQLTTGSLEWSVPYVPGEVFRIVLKARDSFGNFLEDVSAELRARPSDLGDKPILGPRFSDSQDVRIDYAVTGIKPEDLARVEFYSRRPGGKWTLLGVDDDGKSPFAVTGLSDGYHDLVVLFYDASGPTTAVPDARTEAHVRILVDTREPELGLIGFPEGGKVYRGKSTQKIIWRARDDYFPEKPVRLEYSLDTAKWIPIRKNGDPSFPAGDGTSSVEWELPEITGTCFIRAIATDLVGHEKIVTSEAFLVDSMAPEVVLSNFRERAGQTILDYSARDYGSAGVSTVTWWTRPVGTEKWIKGKTLVKTSGSITIPGTTADTEITFTAVDSVGNAKASMEPMKPGMVKVGQNQEFYLTTFQDGGYYQGGDSAPIEWVAMPEHKDLNVKLSYGNNRTGWKTIKESYENIGVYNWIFPKENLTDQYVKLEVKLPSGEEKYSVSEQPFSIDASAPTVGFQARSYNPTSRVKIEFSARDLGGSGVEWLHLYVRKGARMQKIRDIAYVRGKTSFEHDFLNQGRYEIALTASDAVGLESDVNLQTRKEIVVDTTPPAVKLENPKGKEIYEGPPTIEWRYESRDNFELQPLGLELQYSDDRVEWKTLQRLATGTGWKNYKWTGGEGTRYFRLVATDRAGHRSISNVQKVSVLIGKPMIEEFDFTGEKRFIAGGASETFSWRVKGYGAAKRSAKLYYSVDGGVNWILIKDNLPLRGSYKWSVPAVDAQLAKAKVTAMNLNDEVVEAVSEGFQVATSFPVPEVTCDPYTSEPRVAVRYVLPKGDRSPYEPPRTAELWYTEDDGKKWVRLDERKEIDSGPFVFADPSVDPHSENEYGFYIVIYSEKKMLGMLPQDGVTPPLAKVVFDQKRPDMMLGKIPPRIYSPEGRIEIPFKADDGHFGEEPIQIFYRIGRDADWHLIEKNLANSGKYVWEIPRALWPTEGLSFSVKAEAVDRAGNRGRDTSAAFEVIRTLPTPRVTGPSFTSDSPVPVEFRIDNQSSTEINQVIFYVRDRETGTWEKAASSTRIVSPVAIDLDEGSNELYAVFDTEFSMSQERRRMQDPAVFLKPEPEARAQFTVNVDFTPPEVKVVKFGDGDTLFREKALVPLAWEIKDANFDYFEVRIEGSGMSKLVERRVEEIQSERRIVLDVPTGRDYSVVLSAFDRAGNKGTARTDRFAVDGQPPVVDLKKGKAEEGAVKIHYNLRASVEDYAAPARIDIYYRRAGGKKWNPYTSISDFKPPRVFDFREKDGRYELFAATSDVLGNYTPAPGPEDRPHLEVLLQKRIEVSLLGFDRPPPYRGGLEYVVRWVCREKNLLDLPVSFYLREHSKDDWTLLLGRFPNTGSAKIRLPRDINSKTCNLKIVVTNTFDQKGEDMLGHEFEIKTLPPGKIEMGDIEKSRPRTGVEKSAADGDYTPEEFPRDFSKPGPVDKPEPPRVEEKKKPVEPGKLIGKADDLYKRELFHEAIKAYRDAIEAGDHTARAQYGLAKCYMRLEYPKGDVINAFKAALLQEMDYRDEHPCLNDLGVVYFKSGDFENAAKYFARAAELTDLDANAPRERYNTNLGASFYHLKLYNKARASLDKALAFDQHYKDAYWYLAQTFTAMRDWKNAKLYWQRTLRYYGGDKRFGPIAREQLKRADEELKLQRRREE